MAKNTHTVLLCAMILCALCSCRNPFFPPFGMPYKVESLRSKPEGVIKQLVNAYEQQRIDIYEDLFPQNGTFRFYVSDQFVSQYNSRNYVNPPEAADPRMNYINANAFYHYWTQDLEIQGHKKLFSQASAIVFSTRPVVDPGRFNYIVDSAGDTTLVELEMLNGKIDITVNVTGTNDVYSIAIEKQVFLLERDADNLWVIRKWYDFGSQ